MPPFNGTKGFDTTGGGTLGGSLGGFIFYWFQVPYYYFSVSAGRQKRLSIGDGLNNSATANTTTTTLNNQQPDICPYATSGAGADDGAGSTGNSRNSSGSTSTNSSQSSGAGGGGGAASRSVSSAEQQQQQLRCNTLGRLKNLEMTEYQKQKLLNEANTVKIKVCSIQFHELNHSLKQDWFSAGVQGVHSLPRPQQTPSQVVL